MKDSQSIFYCTLKKNIPNSPTNELSFKIVEAVKNISTKANANKTASLKIIAPTYTFPVL